VVDDDEEVRMKITVVEDLGLTDGDGIWRLD
jgi:hypothetical protein